MPSPAELWQVLWLFLERGGPVLWCILAVSVLLWTLVFERYWFLTLSFRRLRRGILARWDARADRSSWYAHRVRDGLIGEASMALGRSLAPIRVLTVILPMLGLLGTVTGMIETFDVLSAFGTSNPRGMAEGISKALITTLAGLVAALPGLYFSADLRRRTEMALGRTADLLVFH